MRPAGDWLFDQTHGKAPAHDVPDCGGNATTVSEVMNVEIAPVRQD